MSQLRRKRIKSARVVAFAGTCALTLAACGDEGARPPKPNPNSPWRVAFVFDEPPTRPLKDVWFSARDDGWACAYRRVFHYNGERWWYFTDLEEEFPGVAGELSAISAPSSSEVWVGGQPTAKADFFHFDGNLWETVDTGYPLEYVQDIFFLTPELGWAAASGAEAPTNEGTLLRYGGRRWTREWEAAVVLEKLYFLAPDDGWAYGYDSASSRHVYRLQGRWWKEVEIPGARVEYYNALDFTGPADGWVLGRRGDRSALYHYDGAAWLELTSPATARALDDADFVSPVYGWLAGEESWFYDGESFTSYPWPYERYNPIIIRAVAEDDVWAATLSRDNVIYVYHFTGFK